MMKTVSIALLATFAKGQRIGDRFNDIEDPDRDGLKDRVQRRMMQAFFTEAYQQQLDLNGDEPKANSAVANVLFDVMNVAAPDETVDYWVTFLPVRTAPIINLKFPTWSDFSSLTIYNTLGLTETSLNNMHADASEANLDPRITKNTDGTVTINLLQGIELSAPDELYILCFRVYRPLDLDITPQEDLPRVRLVELENVNEPVGTGQWLPNAGLETALAHGTILGDRFNSVIGNLLPALSDDSYNGQLAFPTSGAGLFPNDNGSYVDVYMSPDTTCLRVESQVPDAADFRAFYGFMAVDYTTTRTKNSLIYDQLGGWGAKFILYAARSEDDAIAAGYDQTNDLHKLLLFAEDVQVPWLIIRYLHHFEDNTDLSEESKTLAIQERKKLRSLDGTTEYDIQGIDNIVYFQGQTEL